jgi:hypothetical protein
MAAETYTGRPGHTELDVFNILLYNLANVLLADLFCGGIFAAIGVGSELQKRALLS